MSQLDFPLHFDHRRRTAETDETTHLRELIEQVLFTAPGERVNRPDFGCGLLQLVFAPNGEQLAAATQMVVQSALQQWLSDLIRVDAVEVEAIDSALHVKVQYVILSSQTAVSADFVQKGAGA